MKLRLLALFLLPAACGSSYTRTVAGDPFVYGAPDAGDAGWTPPPAWNEQAEADGPLPAEPVEAGLEPTLDAGAELGAADDSGSNDACVLTTHTNGLAQTWTDCYNQGGYPETEALAACRAYGAAYCNVAFGGSSPWPASALCLHNVVYAAGPQGGTYVVWTYDPSISGGIPAGWALLLDPSSTCDALMAEIDAGTTAGRWQ